MADEGIAEPIKQFIFENVDSVELLEVLLFVYRQNDRTWSADEIGQELRSNPRSVAQRLEFIQRLGFIAPDDRAVGRYQLKISSLQPEQTALLAELAEAYRVRRHQILELIFSPLKKARHFADAFTIGRTPKRKEDQDG